MYKFFIIKTNQITNNYKQPNKQITMARTKQTKARTKQTKARNDQNIDEFTKIFNNEMPKTMKIEDKTDEKEINYGPTLKKLFTIVKQPKTKQVKEINYGPTLNKLFKQSKNEQINELVDAAKVKEAEATQIINKILTTDI